MIGVVTRAGSLAPYLRGASATVSSSIRATSAVVPPSEGAPKTAAPPQTTTFHALAAAQPPAALKLASGPTIKTQVRYAHTDVKFPDYSAYRLKSSIDPNKPNEKYESNKAFTYLVSTASVAVTIYGAKNMVHKLVSYLAPSADVLALGKIEVNLKEIPEGKSVVFKWRGKPLFIRHRNAEEIAREQGVDPSVLRDQQHDSVRVKDPKWLVVIGVCTHLGCVPIANAGDFGGFYCPCHGSHYDASGRIRKGPAPLNLEVPTYSFNNDLLIVG